MQTIKSNNQLRAPRYTKSLPEGQGTRLVVPRSWEGIEPADITSCDPEFLEILRECGFGNIKPVVPLKRRYTRGRRWTKEEFKVCFAAWQSGISLTRIAAALNRNPQDMIYRLLDYCHEQGIKFTEQGRSEGVENWTPQVANCASKLFAAGLPAWKIATLFRVDFEHVEKQVFIGRDDYGHRKQNPFTINTKHKYFANEQVLSSIRLDISDALDAFAGEGKTTEIISHLFPHACILATESDAKTFSVAQEKKWGRKITWLCEDNLSVIQRCAESGRQFDLIDLDPFVTCYKQLNLIWPLLRPSALLFITFGGEYRRSFIASNRKAIATRYSFYNADLGNSDYLEIVPFFFLGWVATLAGQNSFTFTVARAIRYANTCRFWLRVNATDKRKANHWMAEHIISEDGGHRFEGVNIPRFAEVRQELEQRDQLGLFK
ncbi:MAG TPA: hypothetical protein VM911_12695 [Pyrinomonadaceae bacterium]|jgi:hypothetical protein|nr:hypothetical protein [Pyrinomonadaceae bacterium]